MDKSDAMAEMETEQLESRFILRKVKIKNFIRFEDAQKCIQFTNKDLQLYLVIGQNHSGKSSIFEGIRRCLSLKHNTSVSSIPDESQYSTVLCSFETDGENVQNKRILYTFLMHRPGDNNISLKGCVLVDGNNDIKDFGIDCVKSSGQEIKSSWEHTNFKRHYETSQVKCETCRDCFKGIVIKSDIDLNVLEKWTSHLIKELEKIPEKTSDTLSKCEALLDFYLREHIVFTFALRGISNVQWTGSDFIESREQNYTDASKRAEVINWFLTKYKQNKHNKQSVVESIQKEEEYYDFITNGDGGEYVLADDGTSIIVKRGDKTWPLLKQSEGFVEAKISSILLAVDEFATVILEDPTTGMHAQMVERLGNLIKERVKDKVVVISTHNQALITPDLIGNTFILQRSKKEKNASNVIPGSVLLNDKHLKNAFPSSISDQQFAGVCFADTVVLVEGKSDQLFLECLIKLMRSNEDHHYGTDQGTCQIEKKDNRPKLSGLYVLPISSVFNESKYTSLCERLKKKYALLIDRDGKTDIKETDNKFVWKLKDLEAVFFEALNKLKSLDVNVKEIETCLTSTFTLKGTKRVTIVDGKVAKIEEFGKCKMFIHGEESYEERSSLFKFLLDPCKTGPEFTKSDPGKELQRIRNFVLQLDSS